MSVNQIEELFLSGNWIRALYESRQRLIERQNELINGKNSSALPMTPDEEQLVSLYLQSTFELGQHDEIETAKLLLQTWSPWSFSMSMQWIKFLIAMRQTSQAVKYLNTMLLQCRNELNTLVLDDIGAREKRSQYIQLMELMALQFHHSSSEETSLLQSIQDDPLLDIETKQRLVNCVSSQQAKDVAAAISTTHGPNEENKDLRTTYSHSLKSSPLSVPVQSTNETLSDATLLGGVAIVAAVVAIGVYRNHESIRAGLSKGLADIKYALFES